MVELDLCQLTELKKFQMRIFSMKVNKSENTVMFDIDETVIHWDEKSPFTSGKGKIAITDEYNHRTVYVYPNPVHVHFLKSQKSRGSYVIVWSAGGWAWAEAVIKALGLEEYVDYVMSKPDYYFDDKPADEWMSRVYIGKIIGSLDNPKKISKRRKKSLI